MRSVRIIENGNGTYSAYIFDTCIYTGTYDDCVKWLGYNGEYV
jgi:hypothetical protein